MKQENHATFTTAPQSLRTGSVRRAHLRRARVLAVLLALIATGVMVAPAASAEGIGKVLGVEAGYGLATSTRDLTLENRSGLLSSLYWGYVIGDKPNSMTILSIAVGYEFFPLAPEVTELHRLVYGLEYAHVFFRQSPVSLVADYGLLFNLVADSQRSGYAFGHQTRLGLGAMWNISDRHKLTLNGSYNMVTFPYFETSTSRFSYPGVAVRYSMFF